MSIKVHAGASAELALFAGTLASIHDCMATGYAHVLPLGLQSALYGWEAVVRDRR